VLIEVLVAAIFVVIIAPVVRDYADDYFHGKEARARMAAYEVENSLMLNTAACRSATGQTRGTKDDRS